MKTIMLCSSINSVLDRWQAILEKEYVIEKTSSASKLVSSLLENQVDMVLLHRSTIDKQTVVEILDNEPSTRIFLLTDRPNEREGLTFLQVGVVGYANTYITARRLKEAIRITLTGRVWVGQELMQRLIQATVTGNGTNKENALVTKLSEREREVADLVAAGMTNLAIAFELDIAERTVKAHISSIFQKTGTDSRLKLALLMKKYK
jgi:DNA-binding NarL/FixJ family response regulator